MRMVLTILIGIAAWTTAWGQTPERVSDSVTVEQAVALALHNHPAVRQAEFGVTAAEARVQASHADKYPDVSVIGDYTRIGPVPSVDLPGQGKLEFAPYNNYNLYLDARQVLYDFGHTDQTIRLAESGRQTAADSVALVNFNLAYQTIGVFNSILILERRIAVLDEELATLGQHLDMSVKKMEAGTATDFDTLTIQVRVAVAKSDRIDAAHALESAEIAFRRLTGWPEDRPVRLRGAFAADSVRVDPDSLLAAAEQQRPELVLMRDAEASASARSRLAALGDKPSLAFNLAAGLKNGYEPNLNTWRGNYIAGLQVKIPVFNGYRTRYRTMAADAQTQALHARTDEVSRQVHAEVRQAIAGVQSSREKIASTETQVRQAEEAVKMARVRYGAGVITNLDMLDAEMTLSQAKLIRLKAAYDYTVSLRALDRATGRRVW